MLKERDIKLKWKRTKQIEGKEKEQNPGKGPLIRTRSQKPHHSASFKWRLHTFLQASITWQGTSILCFNLLGWDSCLPDVALHVGILELHVT
jgi:hypothetical protein